MKKALFIFLFVFILILLLLVSSQSNESQLGKMILIEGGEFRMGDVFDEGEPIERPVHRVQLSDFYLSKYEITLEEFGAFVEETGYKTSAESQENQEEQEKIQLELKTLKQLNEKTIALNKKFLSYSGTHCFHKTKKQWSFKHDVNWKNPDFEQSAKDPVTCVSWIDAVHYCNWLSKKERLPEAYAPDTGELLNEKGNITQEIAKVKGYRLPTEAEWEYAARECGRKVRFGNGKNIARSSEINFDAGSGDFSYSEKGEFRGRTVPVGSFEPNSLGFYDLSGNVWEWCSDFVCNYTDKASINPYNQANFMGLSLRIARGGIWAGDANMLRVSKRIGWEAYNRCNNIGFRIAKSKSRD